LQLCHTSEIDCPGSILIDSNFDGFFGVGHARCLKFGPLLSTQEGDEPVLHFLAGGEDLGLIGRDEFLQKSVLKSDVVYDSAVVKNFPLKGRPDGTFQRTGLDQFVQLLG
jgi:hypothetical protein